VFLEMTTAAPATALQLNKIAAPMQAVVLDCPVTGGVSGAQKGTLTHFVGGDKDALARCRPLLETLSERIVFCGDSGAGYRMKLVNQTMVAGILLGLADGTALARASGFDAGILSEALTGGTASSFLFNSYAQRMLECTGPVTFTLGMLRKDLRLARAEAVARGTTTRLLDCALDAAEAACLRFGERAGAQCLAAGDCGGPAPRPDLLTI
jgi:3-hydroxyisobutyrate dehydrogenase-like beta-hydroxyacid dehydrogenase